MPRVRCAQPPVASQRERVRHDEPSPPRSVTVMVSTAVAGTVKMPTVRYASRFSTRTRAVLAVGARHGAGLGVVAGQDIASGCAAIGRGDHLRAARAGGGGLSGRRGEQREGSDDGEEARHGDTKTSRPGAKSRKREICDQQRQAITCGAVSVNSHNEQAPERITDPRSSVNVSNSQAESPTLRYVETLCPSPAASRTAKHRETSSKFRQRPSTVPHTGFTEEGRARDGRLGQCAAKEPANRRDVRMIQIRSRSSRPSSRRTRRFRSFRASERVLDA